MLYQFGMSSDGYIRCRSTATDLNRRQTHLRFDRASSIRGIQQRTTCTTFLQRPCLLTSWVDYRYTFDGYMLIYYGIEGLSYKFTDDYYTNIAMSLTMSLVLCLLAWSLYAASMLQAV